MNYCKSGFLGSLFLLGLFLGGGRFLYGARGGERERGAEPKGVAKEIGGRRKNGEKDRFIPLTEEGSWKGWRVLRSLRLKRNYGKRLRVRISNVSCDCVYQIERISRRDVGLGGDGWIPILFSENIVAEADSFKVEISYHPLMGRFDLVGARWGEELKIAYTYREDGSGGREYFVKIFARKTVFSETGRTRVFLVMWPMLSESGKGAKDPVIGVTLEYKMEWGFSRFCPVWTNFLDESVDYYNTFIGKTAFDGCELFSGSRPRTNWLLGR